jgi:hypothetical protein
MDSSTETQAEIAVVLSQVAPLIAQDWDRVERLMPHDLEEMAKTTRALVRHRGIRRALDLLRIILAYSVCDWSLRLVGAWCVLAELADLSDVAILNRLRNSTPWLGCLIVRLLQRRRVRLTQQAGIHLRLVDATTVSRPGSQGTDWRIHLGLDLGSLCLTGIEVTDARGGESLARFPGQPGEIWIGDRGYAYVRSLTPPLAVGVGLIVRIAWQNLPLQDEQGQRLDLIGWLRQTFALPGRGPQETYVWLTTPQGRYRLRLIASRLPQEAADRARQRAYQAAKKKGRTPDQRTLFAAGFVLLLTNLPLAAWPATRIVELYRIRWQIELLIKRLKSLLNLDGLRAQDPRLVQAYLLGKLLAALLLDELTQVTATCVPDWFTSLERPVSPWRLTACLYDYLRSLIRGPITLDQVLAALPRLQRFLCDSPRKRRQQLAQARTLLTTLSVC